MTSGQLRTVIHRLRRIVGPGEVGLGDAELLRRWVSDRDQAAFEVLLWRHGPMVLGVCRRLLRHSEDVEDAFQATFLALVRHAASVRQRNVLGSWLYRVAYRVAVQARAAAAKRTSQDVKVLESVVGHPDPDPAGRELRAMLDEEVDRLPEHYRAPIVLCYFEGRTNEEAARELGRPVGTILSRLARARACLRRRLTARGLALPAGLLAAAGTGSISRAAVPPAFVSAAIETAARASVGEAIPEHIATAAERAVRAMSMTCTRIARAVFLAVFLLGGSAGLFLCPAPPGNGGEIGNPAALADPKRPADASVTLQWKFQAGQTLYQEVTTVTKQDMTVMGMAISQAQKQTFYFSWRVLEKKDGNWIVEQTIEGVKMEIDIGGNKIEYDSTNGRGAAGPLADFFKALVGARFKLIISPKIEVIGIEGRPEFVNNLVKAGQQMEPLLKQILNEGALRQMADPTLAILKVGAKGPEPVKKGDTWKRTSELDMGPIGKYENTYTYTYEGKDGTLDRIGVTTNLRYTAPGQAAAGGLPFTIKNADLKSKDSTGTIWFDNRKGRLDRSEMKVKLDGKLTIEIGGQATEVKLSQEQKTTVRFSDENPLKPAK
jgi:RNA polymerase sigma factor (sigma-70 family)